MRKVLSLGSVAAAAAAAAVLYAVLPAAAATARGPATSSIEHFQVMSSSATAGTGSIIAYGPITAAGSGPGGRAR